MIFQFQGNSILSRFQSISHLICTFNVIPIQIPASYFMGINKLTPNTSCRVARFSTVIGKRTNQGEMSSRIQSHVTKEPQQHKGTKLVFLINDIRTGRVKHMNPGTYFKKNSTWIIDINIKQKGLRRRLNGKSITQAGKPESGSPTSTW